MSGKVNQDVLERFFDAIEVNNQDCWQWLNSKTADGYGQFYAFGVRTHAHRFSYLVFVGEIKNGLHIDHLCRNRACANPDHLEAVAIKENVLRGQGFAAVNSKKTHCPSGHEYALPNARGRRVCYECMRQASRKHRRL